MDIQLSDIRDLLARIRDPKSGASIVDAGLIKDVFLEGRELNISVYQGNLDAKEKSDLHQAIVLGIQSEYPELDINLHMVSQAADKQAISSPLPQVKHVIAVASGKGGVGKSTVSVNLAYALHRLGYKTGILDADVYGPSIPTMLGIQQQRPKISEVYGKPRLVPIDVNGIQAISIGLIVDPQQALVLRGPRLGSIIKQFIDDTLWDALDFLIVDLPPGTGDVQLTLVQSVPLSGAVLVTTPQEVALADAIRAMNMFRMDQINVNLIGVVENMAWFTPEELPNNKYYIFGKGGGEKLAAAGDMELLGQVPITLSIRENADAGNSLADNIDEGVKGNFEDIARNMVSSLEKIISVHGKSKIVTVKS